MAELEIQRRRHRRWRGIAVARLRRLGLVHADLLFNYEIEAMRRAGRLWVPPRLVGELIARGLIVPAPGPDPWGPPLSVPLEEDDLRLGLGRG